jgi:glycosyltransferase involved in cell wall biosynthesis
MRVAFVSGFAWEPKGTARARAFPLAVELVKKGHDVTLFLTPYDNPAESGRRHELEGVQIVNLDVGEKHGFRHVPLLVQRLCSAIRHHSADVVHVFKPKGYAGAACTWLLITGASSVVLDCDDWEGWAGWNEVKDYPWFVKEYIDRQEKWLTRRAPVVTTASRVLQQRAIELRKSAKGVFYIPNCGVSQDNVAHQEAALSLTSREAKESFGLPDGHPVIFYSGHFETHNEIMFFSRAAAQAALRCHSTIVVVGDGPGLPQMKEFFEKREGVTAHFFPRIPYNQFVRLLAASDVAAFPYPDDPIYQAKCSARVIDYMAMGKAVLTTAVGQNSDYIVDGDSGLLVPPADEARFTQELVRLLQDADLRARLGRSARQRVKAKFLWSGEPVDSCLAAYRQLSG